MKTHSVAVTTLLAPIAWGTTYLTITQLLPPDRPFLVAALRVLPAGAMLAGVGLFGSGWRPRGRQWIHLAVLALFNFGIFFPLLITAVYRLPGGVAASMGGLQPLLVAGLSRLIRGVRPGRLDVGVGLAAAIGVAMVVRPGAAFDPVGVVAALGANLSFSAGVVLTKALPPPEKRLAATGWQLLLSALVLVPLALALEGMPPAPTTGNIFGFAYLSLAATGLAFVLWFSGIKRLPVQAPPLLGLAAPVTGAALGWMVLDEALSTVQIAGFVITIASIAYGTRIRSAQPGDGAAAPEVEGPWRGATPAAAACRT
jgi:probable blue pigment (indigoidine) exporter